MSHPKKVAVIGANGFIGSRLVELFHLRGLCEVVPIVRGVSGLSRLSRFDLDWRLADARQTESLAKALAGCDAVVHSVVGDSGVIETAAAALLPAAAQAGVRRVVYLSTASVHGQNPAPGTSEESALSDRQVVGYNNAKVRAERTLFRDSRRYPVELIALRPSIVFGPRDRWISSLAAELKMGTAWLINNGEGICNTIYVDNLIHAVFAALGAPQAAVGQAYLVGDGETVTWADLYRAVASSIGIDIGSVHQIDEPKFSPRTIGSRLSSLKSSKAVQAVLPWIPAGIKRGTKGFLAGWAPKATVSDWRLPVLPYPALTYEMVELQRCKVRLPQDRAAAALGYSAVVSFQEGIARTIAWLEWCGHLKVNAR